MSGAQRQGLSWSARALVGLVLLLVGAAAMVWTLGHFPRVAHVLGVQNAVVAPAPSAMLAPLPSATSAVPAPNEDARIASIEQRLGRMEAETAQAQGSAGRADALVVAFAARRAIDRGVALGYLEPLLVQRFGAQQQAAVATVVTSSRNPVKLGDLIAEYRDLGPELRRGGPNEGFFASLKRELGGLVTVHNSERPSPAPDARYQRALEQLTVGNVDAALAETMRLPGASSARTWIDRARRYVASQRALDQLESAALLGNGDDRPS